MELKVSGHNIWTEYAKNNVRVDDIPQRLVSVKDFRELRNISEFQITTFENIFGISCLPLEVQKIWNGFVKDQITTNLHTDLINAAHALNPYYPSSQGLHNVENPTEFTCAGDLSLLRNIGLSYAALDWARIYGLGRLITALSPYVFYKFDTRFNQFEPLWREKTLWSDWVRGRTSDINLEKEGILKRVITFPQGKMFKGYWNSISEGRLLNCN